MNELEKHKIHDKLNDHDQSINDLKLMVSTIERDLRGKVSYKMFWSIIGILMTVVTGLLGIIYATVEKINDRTYTTQQNVSEIQGTLKAYKFGSNN